MNFTVVVDGKEINIPQPSNDLKVIVESNEVPVGRLQLHFTFTYEGLITDLVYEDDTQEDVIAASSETYSDLSQAILDECGLQYM